MSTVLNNSGKSVIMQVLHDSTLYMAWGTGDPVWDITLNIPPPAATDIDILAEVGRRRIINKQFAVPDPLGTIFVTNGIFSLSASPSSYLYIEALYDIGDAPTSNIREAGIYYGTVVDPTLPLGQLYFTPSQVVTKGSLFMESRFAKIVRSPLNQERLFMVIGL